MVFVQSTHSCWVFVRAWMSSFIQFLSSVGMSETDESPKALAMGTRDDFGIETAISTPRTMFSPPT